MNGIGRMEKADRLPTEIPDIRGAGWETGDE